MAVIPYLGTTLPPESTMIKYFGPINDASQEVTVPFAGRSVTVNRVLAANVRQLGARLAAAGYVSYIRDVGGFRTSKGASGAPIPYSMHQFGAAFDINEDGGPNGDWHTMTLPRGLVGICAAAGWFCGENWQGASRDGGHFQFTGGPVPAVDTGAAGSAASQAGDLITAALAGAAIPAAMIAALFAAAVIVAAVATAAAVGGAAYVASRNLRCIFSEKRGLSCGTRTPDCGPRPEA